MDINTTHPTALATLAIATGIVCLVVREARLWAYSRLGICAPLFPISWHVKPARSRLPPSTI
jgi:hypothetical protein